MKYQQCRLSPKNVVFIGHNSSSGHKKCTRPNLKFRTRARRFHIPLTDGGLQQLTVAQAETEESPFFFNSSNSKSKSASKPANKPVFSRLTNRPVNKKQVIAADISK